MRLQIFLLISTLCNLSYAQSGWIKKINIDEYTQEKMDICVYNRNGQTQAVFYPNEDVLKIIKNYDGLQYFDDSWNALIYNGGKLTEYNTNITERFIFNNDFTEYDIENVNVGYNRLSRAGQDFFSFFYVNEKVEDLKKAKSVSYKWYDILDEEITVINISLIGFTKCYNSCRVRKKITNTNSSINNNEEDITSDNDESNISLDSHPEFPGGQEAFKAYISKNIRYPATAQEKNIQGKVVAKFLIDKEGNIKDPTIINGICEECDNEVLRLINNMPKWIPAKQNGNPIDEWFTMPIMFKRN